MPYLENLDIFCTDSFFNFPGIDFLFKQTISTGADLLKHYLNLTPQEMVVVRTMEHSRNMPETVRPPTRDERREHFKAYDWSSRLNPELLLVEALRLVNPTTNQFPEGPVFTSCCDNQSLSSNYKHYQELHLSKNLLLAMLHQFFVKRRLLSTVRRKLFCPISMIF